MANKPLDFLAINKSKLIDSYRLDTLQGYNIVRRDRNKHSGGVFFYLRNTITFSRQYQLENDDLELIASKFRNQIHVHFLLLPGTGHQTHLWIILKNSKCF